MTWAWFTQNKLVLWIGGGIVFVAGLLLGWEKIKFDIRKAAKMSEREANARKVAEAERRTVETIRTIEKDARHDADKAVAARDHAPVYPDAASVPDDVARRIFKD